FVKLTSLGLNRPMRSSAALPFLMALVTEVSISFVVVSKVGIVTTELNLALLALNCSRLPSAIGVGLCGTLLQPARIEEKARKEMIFQRIMIACKLLPYAVRSSAIPRD